MLHITRDIISSKCPYCGNENMLRGHIFSGRFLPFWFPGDKLPLVYGSKKSLELRGGILLGKPQRFSGLAKHWADSFYCWNCGVIITDVKTADS